MNDTVELGPFGHHPDPATDFCCEVEALEGEAEDVRLGLRSQWPFWPRLSRALRAVRLNEIAHDAWTPGAINTLCQLEGRVITGKSPHGVQP